jgi:hypothetical protein
MSTTAPTAAPAVVPAPSANQLLSIAEQTVEAANNFLPEIEAVSGMIPGVGAEAIAIEQAAGLILPGISRTLKFMMAETGKPLLTVIADFMDHITPGLPTSPVLSAAPAAPASPKA